MAYEEVGLYYPRKSMKRPILLIGDENLELKELQKMILQNTEKFDTPTYRKCSELLYF